VAFLSLLNCDTLALSLTQWLTYVLSTILRMATQAHCAYCFESLAADLEKRPGLSLHEVEALWSRYNSTDDAGAGTDDPATSAFAYKPAAVNRLLASTPSSGSSSSSTPNGSTPSGMSANSSATSLSSEDKSVREHPLFVTWNVSSSRGEKQLRGCIGTFSPQELDEGLKDYAVISYVVRSPTYTSN
jgi:hypothetical protein